MTRALTRVSPPVICDPSDDRCVQQPGANFLSGISVRHSPSCTGAICGLFSCDGGNWRVTTEGTLDRSQWIKGWIVTQLFTRAFLDCEEHPLGQRGGGWWADAFRTDDFKSGSKLWALLWTHGGASNQLLLTAKTYALEALQPLMGWGVVSSINVDALYVTRFPFDATIQLDIRVVGPGVHSQFSVVGERQPNYTWLWQEYMPHRAETGGRLYARA